MTYKEKLELAEAEIARLENIIAIQQKQIERLMDERDVEALRIDRQIARAKIAARIPAILH